MSNRTMPGTVASLQQALLAERRAHATTKQQLWAVRSAMRGLSIHAQRLAQYLSKSQLQEIKMEQKESAVQHGKVFDYLPVARPQCDLKGIPIPQGHTLKDAGGALISFFRGGDGKLYMREVLAHKLYSAKTGPDVNWYEVIGKQDRIGQ